MRINEYRYCCGLLIVLAVGLLSPTQLWWWLSPTLLKRQSPPPTIVPVRTTLIRMIRLHDQMYPLPGWIIYRLYLWLFLTMAASVNVIFSSFVIDGNKFGYYRFFIYSFLLLIMENTLCIDTKRLSWLGSTSLSTKRQWLRNDDNQTFSFSYFLC